MSHPPYRYSVTDLSNVASENSYQEDSSSKEEEEEERQVKTTTKCMVVFSGGTAFNTIAHELQQGVACCVAHVLPVSDDGGSTAEIVRVLGGPAVGDIRSRCLRLSDESTVEARAVKHLLGHRLLSQKTAPSHFTRDQVRQAARQEWLGIVEGDDENDDSLLWRGISSAYKDTIRAFLIHFHVAVLRHATEKFDFTGGSVGNFFFAGARIFFQSMNAAIFLYSRVSGIPPESLVLPAVVTEERLTLGALLKDGTRIRGQCNISHPAKQRNESGDTTSCMAVVNKEGGELFGSPIHSVTYLYHDPNQPNNYWDDKQQVHPRTNPQVLKALDEAGCIVYGMGSLYTSILPNLILDGVAERIASSKCPKVLLLNGWHDRETSWRTSSSSDDDCCGMDAAMFVKAVVNALQSSYRRSTKNVLQNPDDNKEPVITDYVTHVLYPAGGEVHVNQESLRALCDSQLVVVQTMEVPSILTTESSELNLSGGKSHHRMYQPKALVCALAELADQLLVAPP